MPTVNVRLSDQAHQLLTLRCRAEGTTVCGSSRSIIEKDLQKEFKMPVSKRRCPRREEEKQSVTLMLTTSEIEAIDRLKNHIGGTRNKWIIEAIRAGLTSQPSFAKEEIEALNANTYAVKNYARGIKQWASRLQQNGVIHDTAAMQKVQDSVDTMITKMADNCAVVDRLICASRDRWSIK